MHERPALHFPERLHEQQLRLGFLRLSDGMAEFKKIAERLRRAAMAR
jgi:hypothetical protein